MWFWEICLSFLNFGFFDYKIRLIIYFVRKIIVFIYIVMWIEWENVYKEWC